MCHCHVLDVKRLDDPLPLSFTSFGGERANNQSSAGLEYCLDCTKGHFRLPTRSLLARLSGLSNGWPEMHMIYQF